MITHTGSRRLRVGGAIAATMFALTAVAACGGGSSGSNASSGMADSTTRANRPQRLNSLQADSVAGTSAGNTAKAKDAALIRRQVISTGDITLLSKDVADTRMDIMHAVTRWHGSIADEETSADDRGRVRRVSLTVRVPSARFDDAMTGIAGFAHATHQGRSAKDVTTKVIDTDSRVRAKERAVAQLERLLDRADDLGQVIRLEGDISQRQAELDSLKHQQAYLKDQTSMSTITVDISRQRAAGGTTHDAGLFAGLGAGAHAFSVALVWLLTAIGALAPFAAAIAVVAVPVWLFRRRRRSAAVDVVDQAG